MRLLLVLLGMAGLGGAGLGIASAASDIQLILAAISAGVSASAFGALYIGEKLDALSKASAGTPVPPPVPKE